MFKLMIKILMVASIFLSVAYASDSDISMNDDGIAIQGYDPVSYFNGDPNMGNPAIKFSVDDATYYFLSEENREKFVQNPAKYQPQFGGFCSFGVSLGQKFQGKPTEYAVYNDNLYLFYKAASKRMWEDGRDRRIQLAERYWPQIRVKNPVSGHADFW